MPKLKTKKTLKKRVKITKTGKLVTKQIRTGHLKRKWSASKKSRKLKPQTIDNSGHKKIIKNLLAKEGKGVK
ncbi:50S ribosomal protein L35 [Patescibacteria group bacterium]|nr:50S ribosomal protein L35 [Patescibacteria group bacterium]